MRERSNKNKRRNSSYNTICTILGTLLVVAIVWVISLAWNTLGKKTNEVSYSAGETDFVGSVPATRKFEPGDEVVVRAAELSMSGKEFAGWKDANDVLDYASDILVNGTVFIMPEADVLLEAVWEDEGAREDDENSTTTSSAKEESDAEIYHIDAGKDYVNVRNNHGYDSKVIAKISDADIEIEYNGKFEEVYDHDEEKSYDWYFVEIPSKNIEGWIRSDLLSKASSKSSSKSGTSANNGNDEEGQKYLKSHKYDVALMHEDADSSSEVIEKIEDDETILYFNNESEEVTDSDGDKTTWYFVKNSESGNSGWIDSKRLVHAE